MDQEIFQSVKVFLEREKGCSNVESEVPISERDEAPDLVKVAKGRTTPKVFCRIDVVGGRLHKGRETKDCCTSVLELHCVEYKSPNDDLIKGIGQLLWYKFLMSAQNIWADRLFLYLLMHEGKVTDELGGFCRYFGIGLLQMNSARIVTEVVTPEDQHGLIAREMKMTCPKCFKNFTPEEVHCLNCGSSLTPGIFWRFADTFGGPGAKKTRVGRPGCITPNMPYEIRVTPMLRKVFQDWSKVETDWRARYGEKEGP